MAQSTFSATNIQAPPLPVRLSTLTRWQMTSESILEPLSRDPLIHICRALYRTEHTCNIVTKPGLAETCAWSQLATLFFYEQHLRA